MDGLGFDSRNGKEVSLLSIKSRPTLGPNTVSYLGGTRGSFPGDEAAVV
jgi:hypothetical protein